MTLGPVCGLNLSVNTVGSSSASVMRELRHRIINSASGRTADEILERLDHASVELEGILQDMDILELFAADALILLLSRSSANERDKLESTA